MLDIVVFDDWLDLVVVGSMVMVVVLMVVVIKCVYVKNVFIWKNPSIQPFGFL